MAIEQEGAPADTATQFSSVIQEHLELRRRNAALEHEMPLERYMPDDPFENHPLFKTEEQARIEDTLDGVQSIVDEPTSVEWPAAALIPDEPAVPVAAPPEEAAAAAEGTDEESAEASEEGLWSRSRDFDWGD
jgi:hypothetical protein